MDSSRLRTIHGVLVRVFGRGVLLLGDSGTGKTTCALELMTCGHQFVADDVVELELIGNRLFGKAPSEFRRIAHIRDRGFVQLGSDFGSKSFADVCEIDLITRLKLADPKIQPSEPEILLGKTIPAFDLDSSDVGELAKNIENLAAELTSK